MNLFIDQDWANYITEFKNPKLNKYPYVTPRTVGELLTKLVCHCYYIVVTVSSLYRLKEADKHKKIKLSLSAAARKDRQKFLEIILKRLRNLEEMQQQ